MRLMCEAYINLTASLVLESRASATRKGVELVLTMEGWGFFGRQN
jgi:hypothetical protein